MNLIRSSEEDHEGQKLQVDHEGQKLQVVPSVSSSIEILMPEN